MNAADRIRQNIRHLIATKKLKQNRVAELAGHNPPWLNAVIKGRRQVRWDDLDALADALDVPVGELVAPPGSLKQVNADEATLLRWFRAWPASTRRALLEFLSFWADEKPADTRSRQMHELWKRMTDAQRSIVFGFALEKVERGIPPDIERELFERLTTESKAALETPTKRQRP